MEYIRPLSADSTVSYFLAESRDYVFAGRRTLSSGKVTGPIDINYRKDPSMGWVLDGWTSISYGADGNITNRYKSQVTEIKSGHAIAADQFDVSFPEG